MATIRGRRLVKTTKTLRRPLKTIVWQSPTDKRLEKNLSMTKSSWRGIWCMHQIPRHDQMVAERSYISHRSPFISPKVNRTITRWSATSTRLPKTTQNFAVMAGCSGHNPKCDWGIKLKMIKHRTIWGQF